MKKSILFFYLFFLLNFAWSQNLFHSDSFYGGVTCAGFSTGQGAGTDTIYTHIEPGSSIKKAYLFSYTQGDVKPDTVIINNELFSFNPNNKVMHELHALSQLKYINLYYKDITDFVQNNITNQYVVSIFNEPNLPLNWGTWTATIYIEYENPTLPKVNTVIWVNDKPYTGDESYVMTDISPIDFNLPVGFSIISDRSCSSINDGTIVNINNATNDTIWGEDQSSINGCNGVKGHFYYQNNTLYGLDDDTPDSHMYHSDALADISTYLTNSNSFNLNLKHTFPQGPATNRNVNMLFISAYTSPCDTFNVSTSFENATICKGDTIGFVANGGDNYYWQPNFGISCDNCSNPFFFPDSSTYFSLTVEKDNGCKKTIPVVINVIDKAKINNLTAVMDTCGFNTGVLVVDANGSSPLTYALDNGNFESGSQFNHLSGGLHQLAILDGNGCLLKETVTIPSTIVTNANFVASPNPSTVDSSVELINQSTDYTNSIWYIFDQDNYTPLDSFYTQNASYTFADTGLYNAMLVVYNQTPNCADTTYNTIQIVPPFSITIPNVFTPNQDLINDIFTVDLIGAKAINTKIYNRWGNLIYENEAPISFEAQTLPVWDGLTSELSACEDGTYFYVITIITATHQKKSFSGTVQVFR